MDDSFPYILNNFNPWWNQTVNRWKAEAKYRPPMPQLLRPPEIFTVYFNLTIIKYIFKLKQINYNLYSDTQLLERL